MSALGFAVGTLLAIVGVAMVFGAISSLLTSLDPTVSPTSSKDRRSRVEPHEEE